MTRWNPWHGCRRISEGCLNCYVYSIDASHGKDGGSVYRTSDFDLPLRRRRNGEYAIASGQEVVTCLSSDFFLDTADCWRAEAWDMIRRRPDVSFFIITKRITRAAECLPADWGAGYGNVTIACTVENQRQCDVRMPVFLSFPAARRCVICEPLLERIDLHLTPAIEKVSVGGESGRGARECRYEWVTDIRRQCIESGVGFCFRQTGAVFVKDGRTYRIARKDQTEQARKADIDYLP